MRTKNGFCCLLASNWATGSQYELLGLVSKGWECTSRGYPSIYTKISAIYPWLMEIIKDASTQESWAQFTKK